MPKPFRLIPDRLRELLTTPTAELSRWQYAASFFIELCRHGWRQLRQDRAGQMAAALAFRTIFGIVPVVIIAILIFRAFGGAELFAGLVDRLLAAAKLQNVAGPVEGETLGEFIRRTVFSISDKLNGKTVGLIGAVVLGWTAIGLLSTIERCFNAICQAPENRSLTRRIPLYWFVVTFGPLMLFLSFQMESRFEMWIAGWGLAGTVVNLIGLTTAFLATWLFLLGLYWLMPHTRLHLAAVSVGAMVAAVFWMGSTNAFAAYFAWSFRSESSAFTILYGSLGLIPLFLFWVYLLWLIVLYGLEISAALQAVGMRMDREIPERAELPPLTDPAAVVPLMHAVAKRFQDGLPTTPEQIVDAARLPRRAVDLLLDALVQDGLLHRVDQAGQGAYALARPADRITTAEVLGVAHRLTDVAGADGHPVRQWLAAFRQSQLRDALHKPLAEL